MNELLYSSLKRIGAWLTWTFEKLFGDPSTARIMGLAGGFEKPKEEPKEEWQKESWELSNEPSASASPKPDEKSASSKTALTTKFNGQNQGIAQQTPTPETQNLKEAAPEEDALVSNKETLRQNIDEISGVTRTAAATTTPTNDTKLKVSGVPS